MLGRLLVLISGMSLLLAAKVLDLGLCYWAPGSRNDAFGLQRDHLGVLGILTALFAVMVFLNRRHALWLTWILVPAWILSLTWWALLFPNYSMLQVVYCRGWPNGWITWAWGSAYWLTIFIIARLYLRANQTLSTSSPRSYLRFLRFHSE